MLPLSFREYFEDEFCEWYEPGGKKKGYSRKSNQTIQNHIINWSQNQAMSSPKPY
jgi:hypothetical protein